MTALQGSRVMTFVAITDPDRALRFYRDTLGLSFIADEPFALIFRTADGIGLRLSKVTQLTPAPYTVLGWAVPDIHDAAQALGTRGVVFERFDGFAHDALGVLAFPNGDQVAWFKDPDGNLLSLTQFQSA